MIRPASDHTGLFLLYALPAPSQDDSKTALEFKQVQGVYNEWTNHLCKIKSCWLCMLIWKNRSGSVPLVWWVGETCFGHWKPLTKALAARGRMWSIWMQHHNLTISLETNQPQDVLEDWADTLWLCALLCSSG